MGGHHGKDDDDDHDDMSREDMKRLEGYMKMEFAMEVAHIAVVYKEYKVIIITERERERERERELVNTDSRGHLALTLHQTTKFWTFKLK